MNELPRKKVWRHERLLSEHAFDKLRMIDCGFAKFAESLEGAEVIEEVELQDDRRNEERIVTVYEPDDDQWSNGYRRRR